MKILIVAFTESIHTVRWINQIIDQGWDIRLFSSVDNGVISSELKKTKVYQTFYSNKYKKNKDVKITGIPVFSYDFAIGFRFALKKFFPKYREWYLKWVIKKFKPDIIHSMEIQHAGYLVNEVKKKWKGKFPKWIVTNWGSDIYFFGQLKEHKPKIREVLSCGDFYSCECQRDVGLAKQFGLKSQILPVFPNSGGFDLKKISVLRQKGKPSLRQTIVLKGYQDMFGRALVGLDALRICGKSLKDYKLIIYSAPLEVTVAAKLLVQSLGLKLKILPLRSSHQEILKAHGQARISIGLSVSDAISTMVLEAMAMGSFPIQTNTSCADEWIENGKTGFLVPPENPEIIAKAIRTALADNQLVDGAAKINLHTIRQRADNKLIKKKIVAFYQDAQRSSKKSLNAPRFLSKKKIIIPFLIIWIFFNLFLWATFSQYSLRNPSLFQNKYLSQVQSRLWPLVWRQYLY